jgi:Pyridine nucleotide-disulphide oxidoreductase
MPDAERYEILVIGSAEAGKHLTWTMAQAGHRTAVVERKYIGGSCPNIACLPSKNVIRSAKAHILVAFLGYALWVTLKHLLKRNHSDLSPARALALLATLQSADIVLPTTHGRELRLRRITTPTPDQQQLLNQLRLTLPDRFNLNFECSVDSAIA